MRRRVLQEVNACRAAHPQHYIKINAFDSVRGFETMRLSFIVNRPESKEPGFRLDASGRARAGCSATADPRYANASSPRALEPLAAPAPL
jgi:ribulose-bisphosphate carboxylase small chain